MKNILYGGKRKPRLWAVLLISAMALTLLPVRLSPARAAMPATGDANDGVDFAALSTKGNGFYYGAYNHAVGLADGYYGMAIKDGTPTPILWRVMGEEAGVGYEGYITALSEYVLDSTNFYTDQSTNVYENSNIKSVLAAMVADTNNFPTAERNGMATVSVVTGMYSGAEMTGPQQPGPVDYPVISAAQTLYLPSGGDLGSSNVYWEAGNTRNAAYLLAANQNDNVATLKSGTGGNVIYLTRSPSPSYTNIAACVTTNGVGIMGRVDYVYGVRPAFKLDPASVIFASEIADAPTTAGQTLADADNYAESAGAANYKLTVLNTALSGGTMTADEDAFDGSSDHPTVPAASGGGVSVEAAGATASTKLTYKIVDSDHNIVGYGQGADNAELTVDAKDLAGADLAGGSYTVYVWAQKNNDIHSHEGSQP
ncbi:MAG: DUF6273 domain-containing protein, partial [Oscillospiraceae bacterium]|nr:DUF6273 domain-containing protein [Oscillospiraceae bacterium]